jgi:uncharacterized protein YndB with AHSA1/START domain
MADILHRIGVQHSSPDAVYDAVATIDGLSRWWTTTTTGVADGVGGVIQFRFAGGGFDMEVVELKPAERVVWRVIDGPPEWIDTTVNWECKQEDGWTIVLFSHAGWREPVEFMHHCSTKWAAYLMSMKELLEAGAGRPDPNELRIGNWL